MNRYRQPTQPSVSQQQQAAIQRVAVAITLTGTCWDKCVIHKDGTKLNISEKNCLHNCTQRNLDVISITSRKVLEMLQMTIF